jgi:hypothetical protein
MLNVYKKKKQKGNKTYVLRNKISRVELTRRCNMAWDNSFGKLTKEENDLLFSVPIKISIEALGEGEQPVESIIEPKKTAITPHPPNG